MNKKAMSVFEALFFKNFKAFLDTRIFLFFLIVVAAALGWLVWQSGIFNAVVSSNSRSTEIYFGNSALDPETDCQTVFPVKRVVSVEAPARPSLEELFMGPSESEKEAGYFTSIPVGVKINSLKIENNVAYVDLSEELEKGVGGSCRVTAIRFQITKTLKQFPSISSVVISISGRTEDILQP